MKNLEMRRGVYTPRFSRNPLCYWLGHELTVGEHLKYGGYSRWQEWRYWYERHGVNGGYVDTLWSCRRKGCRKVWYGENATRKAD